MAKQTYILPNGCTKTFDGTQFRALVKRRQQPEQNGDHRISQNAVMEDLADSVHVSFSAIKHWFNGHNAPGSPEIVGQIADYFGVEVEQLLMTPQDGGVERAPTADMNGRIPTNMVYYIKERLTLRTAEVEEWVAACVKDILRNRLAQIGTNALLGSNRLWKMQVTTDGHTFRFLKGIGLEELKQIIPLIGTAEYLELYMDYDFYDAFELTEYLDTLEQGEMKGIFYTMYHTADSNPILGPLLAYGEKDGVFYSGKEIERKSAAEIPADTVWESVYTDIFCEPDQMEGVEKMDLTAISRICHALTDAFDTEESSPVYEDEKGLSYWLNNPTLRGTEDVKKYIALVGELVRLTGDQIDHPSAFTEVGPNGPRTMYIDFDRQGNATVRIAQV